MRNINDIMNVSLIIKLILFADDTNEFTSDSDLKSLIVKAHNNHCDFKFMDYR